MPKPALVCTDGSDPSLEAVAAGLELLARPDDVVVATVIEDPDPTLVTGASGFAGGAMSAAAFDELRGALQAEGERVVAETANRLGIDDADTRVLHGHPGRSLCALAEEIDASVMVMGTRGRGGIKRALLGSVSDYVTRNAPCPVLIARDTTPD
jgi:nucleotide-binding universal stress UspA family protein